MKLYLSAVIVFGIIGCFNIKSNKEDKDLINDLKSDSILIANKKVQLIETVLNLPDVINVSKLKLIRKEYNKVFILLKDSEFKDIKPSIIQDGYQLIVLNSLDSLDTTKQPCYIFTKMEIKDDTAYVQMIFDITGALAFGKLNYTEGHWIPDKAFTIGVR